MVDILMTFKKLFKKISTVSSKSRIICEDYHILFLYKTGKFINKEKQIL